MVLNPGLYIMRLRSAAPLRLMTRILGPNFVRNKSSFYSKKPGRVFRDLNIEGFGKLTDLVSYECNHVLNILSAIKKIIDDDFLGLLLVSKVDRTPKVWQSRQLQSILDRKLSTLQDATAKKPKTSRRTQLANLKVKSHEQGESEFPVVAYATCDELDLEALHKGLIAQDLYIPTKLSDGNSYILYN